MTNITIADRPSFTFKVGTGFKTEDKWEVRPFGAVLQGGTVMSYAVLHNGMHVETICLNMTTGASEAADLLMKNVVKGHVSSREIHTIADVAPLRPSVPLHPYCA